ncbi:hypothetical protein ACH9D2_10240 [Kocuria sp. M4R2S49]|uniref:hypothetical protein n=1 Tax=Kocuria rhizosphaericola TaxID=3376284 RepID=UPI0037BD8005
MVVTPESETPESGTPLLLEREANIGRLPAIVDVIPSGRGGPALVEGTAWSGKSRMLVPAARQASSGVFCVIVAGMTAPEEGSST